MSVSGEIHFLSDSEKDILRRILCPPRSVPTREPVLDVTLLGCEERNDMTLDFFSKCVRGFGVDGRCRYDCYVFGKEDYKYARGHQTELRTSYSGVGLGQEQKGRDRLCLD